MAVVLCLSQGAAFARPGHGNGNDGCRGPDCERGNDRGHDRGNSENKDRFSNGHDNRDHGGERGGGPDHSYYRGERLPSYYRAPQYVVNDWHGHGLRTPPRGYHWVQSGGDYLLVAITTGIILELLLNQ
ncbi:MAG: RcnB family protein [Rhodoferax sp.]|nr:RcnB family protein [Rhodoferax sp.]